MPGSSFVHSEPGLSTPPTGEIPSGENASILDGPACAGGMVWWRVENNDQTLTGWTSEGQGDEVWLVPNR